MQGLMMNRQLMISSLLTHASQNHHDTEIVSRLPVGATHRYTYSDAHRRSRQLVRVLLALGVKAEDRIGTLAWNTHRHFEIYYAVSGMAAICHTINPRLFPEQIAYIANHADDRFIFFDVNFTKLVETLAPLCPTVKGWIALCQREEMPECAIPNLLCYEDLMAAQSDDYEWPEFDENTASSLCYTSGTTGNPKGVLYSHRSTVLHAYGSSVPDGLGLSARDCILPVVPMFHVNAWGLPYACALNGAKLVLPGPHLDGASLHSMFEEEGVTMSAGVPTIWLGLLNHLQENKLKLSTVKRLVIGGSAAPPAMIRSFDDLFGVTVLHAWGMTEMSPLGTVNTYKKKHLTLPAKDRDRIRLNQGRSIFGVEMKITDSDGNALPHDGKAFGDLLVRGPWITSGYFRSEGGEALVDGWFPTGDVATIDADGYMQITDRSKDVIKSGGEWISSIDLENIAVAHPAVAEAAVIGAVHPKWDERPLLVVIKKAGKDVTREDLIAFYEGKVAKWWIPDDVIFVDELPHTATGKLSKLQLRERLSDYRFPGA
ncbi:MAG: fatty-acid--CoA ligase [Burkholderiaceae bacterium]|nr:fatty-acid--CoA ligase [Sulfuritalea sp.]MCF8174163.1 fatty-acid--CoA ligase [Burkholderiaceae bacterium]MCF8183622.1 fatty-acid--CoA ligase [Polynucleobacter sp.]